MVRSATKPHQSHAQSPRDGHVRVHDQDQHSSIRFTLFRTQGGLYVERDFAPRKGIRTTQAIEFSELTDFVQWCSEDPCRFDFPLLYQRLLRSADDMWGVVPASSTK